MPRQPIVLVIVLLTGLCVTSASAAAQAPAERDSARQVVAVIQELFDAMAAGDAERAAAVLLPEGQWVSVRPGDGGVDVVAVTPHRDFLVQLAGTTERWLERLWDPEVRVHGPIAVVWTPYDFYRDGVFSHCGMDAFTLVRVGGVWKIASATYTVEPDGCPASPLGDPDRPGAR